MSLPDLSGPILGMINSLEKKAFILCQTQSMSSLQDSMNSTQVLASGLDKLHKIDRDLPTTMRLKERLVRSLFQFLKTKFSLCLWAWDMLRPSQMRWETSDGLSSSQRLADASGHLSLSLPPSSASNLCFGTRLIFKRVDTTVMEKLCILPLYQDRTMGTGWYTILRWFLLARLGSSTISLPLQVSFIQILCILRTVLERPALEKWFEYI